MPGAENASEDVPPFVVWFQLAWVLTFHILSTVSSSHSLMSKSTAGLGALFLAESTDCITRR